MRKVRNLFRGFIYGHKLTSKIIVPLVFTRDVKRRLTRQKQLSYFVLNILDHCNLKCKGCDHFAAIADKRFVSPEDIKNDLARMSKILKGKVKRMGVMGGEPLLHPQLEEILASARRFFPKTIIQLVTNGLLILDMDKDFWRTCREQNIVIVVTKYPIHLDYETMRKTAASHGVIFEFYATTDECPRNSYKAPLDLSGQQDSRKSFIRCFHANRFPLLMEGKWYACTIAPNVRHFNKKYGTNLKLEDGDFLDIYGVEKASELLMFLCRPKPFCRYCDVKNRSFNHKWERSRQQMSEWLN